METLVSVLKKVESMGYLGAFRITDAGLHVEQTGHEFQPNEVEIDHFYRFEGESSQDDEAILYAITTSSGEKGTLIDAYGASGDSTVGAFIRQVKTISK